MGYGCYQTLSVGLIDSHLLDGKLTETKWFEWQEYSQLYNWLDYVVDNAVGVVYATVWYDNLPNVYEHSIMFRTGRRYLGEYWADDPPYGSGNGPNGELRKSEFPVTYESLFKGE